VAVKRDNNNSLSSFPIGMFPFKDHGWQGTLNKAAPPGYCSSFYIYIY